MTKPIGLQLYSLREAIAQDFAGTIRRVAEIGYTGVEPWGGAFTQTTAAEASRLFSDLGLQVTSSHVSMPEGENQAKALEIMAGLGIKRMIIAWLPPDDYKSAEAVQRSCARINAVHAIAKANGLELLYHNHDQEYGLVDGRRVYQMMAEQLDPEIKFEIDTYWVKVAGCDPVAVIKELGTRAPLLHIKDGPGVRGQVMTAIGDGVIDVPAIIKAGENTSDYMIVEIDNCDGDMMTAVQKSYTYLTSKGLARGNKS